MGLDFYLAGKLLLAVVFQKLSLVEDFNGNKQLRFFLPGEVYMAKFTTTESDAKLEIINRPFIRIKPFHFFSYDGRLSFTVTLGLVSFKEVLNLHF